MQFIGPQYGLVGQIMTLSGLNKAIRRARAEDPSLFSGLGQVGSQAVDLLLNPVNTAVDAVLPDTTPQPGDQVPAATTTTAQPPLDLSTLF